jgi:acyl-coenzyme A thioesterase PaaI-like protein
MLRAGAKRAAAAVAAAAAAASALSAASSASAAPATGLASLPLPTTPLPLPPPLPAAASGAAPAAAWRPLNRPAELEQLRGSAALEGHLLYASLRGAAGGLEQYDLTLSPDGARLRALVTLGDRTCGHPSIVHGGALAAVLDDAFGTLFMHSGVGSGFTANLSVDYVRPVPARLPLELAVERLRIEPSKSGASLKVFLQAVVRGAPGGADAETVFARSTALFIAKPSAPSALLDVVVSAAAAEAGSGPAPATAAAAAAAATAVSL